MAKKERKRKSSLTQEEQRDDLGVNYIAERRRRPIYAFHAYDDSQEFPKRASTCFMRQTVQSRLLRAAKGREKEREKELSQTDIPRRGKEREEAVKCNNNGRVRVRAWTPLDFGARCCCTNSRVNDIFIALFFSLQYLKHCASLTFTKRRALMMHTHTCNACNFIWWEGKYVESKTQNHIVGSSFLRFPSAGKRATPTDRSLGDIQS